MKKALVLSLLACGAALTGCYKDNAEDLYPVTGTCDMTTTSYKTVIQPIIQNSCAYGGCHDASTNAGGYNFSTYDGLKTSVDRGRLLGSIKQESGYSPMPKGGTKLPDCQISQIETWVGRGAPND